MYLVHPPHGKTSLQKPPVVKMLHGRGGRSEIAAGDFGWVEKADKEGFIAVFPQASPIDPARPSGAALPENYFRDWTAPTNDTFWWTHKMVANYPYMMRPESPIVHPLDVSFLVAVLHDLQRRHWGDPHHVYVAGFSTGAEMASDFAQSAPNAAAAIVGSIGITRPTELAHPISVFIALGKDDYLARPSPTAWDAVRVAAKERLYGQHSLPTLEQDVAA
jgi:polyhydroxybutyrate depolymerase